MAQRVKGPALSLVRARVTTVAWIQSLAWELPDAAAKIINKSINTANWIAQFLKKWNFTKTRDFARITLLTVLWERVQLAEESGSKSLSSLKFH